MNELEKLLVKYKNRLNPNARNVEALIHHIKKKFDVEEIMLSDLPKPIGQQIVYNAIHCAYNQNLQLAEKDFEWSIYSVDKNQKSKKYTVHGSYAALTPMPQEDIFYIAFEKRIEYFSTNSNRLFLELSISHGVTEWDCQMKTDRFYAYLGYLEHYAKMYGKD